MSKKAMEDSSYIAMDVCFFCNKPKDILINTRFQDISKIHNKVIDKQPCRECEGYMKQGIILISSRAEDLIENGGVDNPYRTGGVWVVTQDFCERTMQGVDFAKNRVMFITNDAARKLGLPDVDKLVE